MANRKLYEAIIALSAQIKGSFSSAFGKARAELQALDEQTRALQRAQADISSYKKLDAAVSETGAKLQSYERQHEIVQNAIKGTEKPSVRLQLQNEKLEESIRKTREALELQEIKLKKASERLKTAGINTEDLDKASEALGEELDALREKQKAYADSVEQTQRPINALGTLLTSAAVLGGFKKIAGGLKDASDAAMGFETAMAGVQRTVGGPGSFTAGLGESFKRLSTQIPLAAGELAGIAETAGQLGIAQSSAETFTAVMGKLGTATDLSASDAATMLAQFANVTGTSDYERLGAAVAALGDSTATTASKIVQMSQGLAASATTAGLSETDILGISAAVGSLGIEAEAGSTAMSTLISTLYKAVETGDGLYAFASTAGMSAETFRRAWAEDAAGALEAFISGLDNVERNGKSAVALLDELGITNVRQTKAILGLSEAGDLLSRSIRLANSAWAENTALNEKAGVMYNTTQAKLTMLQNQYGNLKIAVGDSLTPVLGDLFDTTNSLLGGITAWTEKNPELVRTLAVTTTAAGAAATAVTVYNTAVKAASLIGFAIPAIPAGAAGAIIGIAGAIGLVGSALYNAKEAYEEVIPPVDSLTEKARALRDTMADGRAAVEDAAASALASANVAGRYVDELERLEAAGLDSEDAQRKYRAALELLCQTVPELSQYVDLQTGSIEGGTAALREHTEALVNDAKTAAYQETITEFYAAQSDAIKEQAQNEIKLDMERQKGAELEKKLRLQMEAAAYVQERINQAQADGIGCTGDLERQYDSYRESISATNQELDDSNKRQKNLEEAIRQGAAASAEAEAQIRYAENTMRSLGLAVNETAAAFENGSNAPVEFSERINNALDAAKTDLEALQTAYNNAYDAAYQSIHGQFALWDEAAKLEPLSIDVQIQNAEGQNAYWQSYQDNIALLKRYADEVQGLDSMLASLASGGGGDTKLVNTIAGMAAAVKAGDAEKVERLIAAYQKGDEIQRGLSGDIRDLQVDLEGGVDAIIRTMQEGVEQLNLSDEARQAALNTVEAYAEELGAGDALISASIDRVIQSTKYSILGLGRPNSNGYIPTATGILKDGYASGTDNAERGWKLVGEEGPEILFFQGGETVLNNRETREFLRRPAPLPDVSDGGLSGYAPPSIGSGAAVPGVSAPALDTAETRFSVVLDTDGGMANGWGLLWNSARNAFGTPSAVPALPDPRVPGASGLNMPELPALRVNAPGLPALAAEIPALDSPALSVLDVPGLNTAGLPALAAPNLPALAIDTPGPGTPDVPALGFSDAPELHMPEIPVLAVSDALELHSPDVPILSVPGAPALKTPDLPTLAVEAPSLRMPDSPTLAVDVPGLHPPNLPALTVPDTTGQPPPDLPDLRAPDIYAPVDPERQETGGAVRFLLDNDSPSASGSSAPSGGADSGGIVVNLNSNVQVEGNADQDTVERMRGLADDWAGRILEVIEQRERDRRRMLF